MSPGPPSTRSITSLQGLLGLLHDYKSVNNVNHGYKSYDVTTSQSAMSSDLSSRKSVVYILQHLNSRVLLDHLTIVMIGSVTVAVLTLISHHGSPMI